MAKLKKQEMSAKINAIMGLEGPDSINWTRLSTDDLTVFYVMLGNPESLKNIAKNVIASIVPEAGQDMMDIAKGVMGGLGGEAVEQAMNNPDIRKVVVDRMKAVAANSDLLKNRPILKRIAEQVATRVTEQEKEKK